ncbi:DUF1848 domain-containing protein [Campylobacter hyointestinalis]|uniref:Domain of uncharacterized function (DUF1848) n=1 Tax=Campylobacter hyointestinalis subsp. hyointestinalis TaxID=91352 RepID=A0A9W5EYL9_CAMHY|nr:DUF1848 domain-containing protein [Campylobacter hyointestinalis]PPB68537.1 hypothetical protein CDQ76_05335 [Campylobacter hyointestinalis subsp. hyointestinalis]CUU72662.1 Domain of uncharacterised function (DUF1848) [Campylobacter hyointestinalis subsp. hyointestinalis]CUU83783.1 Domain of uncharacterised function (DUF1848) [Campylobacter hyointestinalis subsp. hyointestinalis]
MIINTGGRTDSVQYYAKWLLKRFEEGYVLSRNPLFPNKVSRYELDPCTVDCVVFCSKNYEPILKNIRSITDKFNTYFHYTITAYGKDIEPGVPSIDKSIQTLQKLSEIVGKNSIVWRYDPVLFTKIYTLDTHIKTFGYMAKQIVPYVQRCIFSFVEMYKRLEVNMPELKALSEADKDAIARELGAIANAQGLYIQTCGTNGDYSKYGIQTSGCMTLEMLGNANGVKFKDLKHKGMRQGCHCIESRDIGAYDSCLNGCKYCYANKSPKKAIQNYKYHDFTSPLILGHLNDTDILQQSAQKSFIQGK